MFNFLKKKKDLPEFDFIKSYSEKGKYFARVKNWNWLNSEQISLMEKDSDGKIKMITMDYWPQEMFLDADGQKTISEDEFTAFYLTDFLVRQFDAFVIKPMGLDRHPELRDMYFGNYEKLVYQAQTDDAALTEKARICAERLGLRFERRFTGYGDLATALEKV